MQSTGNKSGKSNVWVNNSNLAKTVASLDEFKYGFPSNGLTTVSNKWWGSSGKGGDGGGGEEEKNTEAKKDDAASEYQTNSLVGIRKRIAEQGREAIELGLRQGGFDSKRPHKRDQLLLSQIFKSSLPKDWVTTTDSS